MDPCGAHWNAHSGASLMADSTRHPARSNARLAPTAPREPPSANATRRRRGFPFDDSSPRGSPRAMAPATDTRAASFRLPTAPSTSPSNRGGVLATSSNPPRRVVSAVVSSTSSFRKPRARLTSGSATSRMSAIVRAHVSLSLSPNTARLGSELTSRRRASPFSSSRKSKPKSSKHPAVGKNPSAPPARPRAARNRSEATSRIAERIRVANVSGVVGVEPSLDVGRGTDAHSSSSVATASASLSLAASFVSAGSFVSRRFRAHRLVACARVSAVLAPRYGAAAHSATMSSCTHASRSPTARTCARR